jgi:hypothetical protein
MGSRRAVAVDELRTKLRKERRTNKRLRALIDEFRTQLAAIRADLDVQFHRIAQLQAELDATKRSDKPR